MKQLFEENERKGLAYARLFERTGNRALALGLAKKCLEEGSFYRGVSQTVDLLRFFYGQEVYSAIESVSDAMEALFIVRCAKAAYRSFEGKSSADAAGKWGKSASATDPELSEFFLWVQRAGRKPAARDEEQFKRLLSLMSRAPVDVSMEAPLGRLTFAQIVNGLVGGQYSFEGGTLKR